MPRLYVAGHTGLVGSALMRRFSKEPTWSVVTATRAEVDLTRQEAVETWLPRVHPDVVIIAAGRVGGIEANRRYPAEFIYENLIMEMNLIHGAWKAGVKRLLNFGSSCMYPKRCPQPMRAEHLMTGPMEPTSEPYAMAKWAGLSLCDSYNRQYGTRYVTVIPATVYGPGDSFDPEDAHVLSALLRKLYEAAEQGRGEVTLWGSGQARREFLFTDDLAEACALLLDHDEAASPINVGSGASWTIRELADLIAEVVGFRGTVRWDASRPDGAPEKRLDSSLIQAMGWRPRTNLRGGIEQTYRWFLEHELSGAGDATS
ncbi:MAG: GDP-L-fucose synthase [Candidatus Omnitrophica bacterium]|nr:GDP-L-fucose synthase [Candidatus Omnitrophota bacterium]